MRPSGIRNARWKRRLAVLAMFALLFQQVAMAAYACTQVVIPAPPAATMLDCDSMVAPTPELPALCDRHCNQDTPTSPDVRVAHVPPLAAPPAGFAFGDALALPAVDCSHRDVPVHRSDPPPTLRFCSLLI